MLRLCLTALFFVMFSYLAHAGDTAAEEDKTTTPNVVRSGGAAAGEFALDVANQPVSAAYLVQTFGELRGSIILLHDQSSQFDSPLLSQLREDLRAFGWDTLTVSQDYQAPIAADNPAMADAAETDNPPTDAADETTEADEPPAENNVSENTQEQNNAADAENAEKSPEQLALPGNAARMDAAIAWLQAKNPPHLIFIGHGAGIQTAINAIAATPQPVSALVMISANDDITAEKIIDANVPVLDITGSQIDKVSNQAAVMRRSQLKYTTTQPYSPREIVGADRDFHGMETLLGKRVHSWLHRQLIGDVRR
ncbi:MAG: DUF3530 family protein [Methylophaga sp.]